MNYHFVPLSSYINTAVTTHYKTLYKNICRTKQNISRGEKNQL